MFGRHFIIKTNNRPIICLNNIKSVAACLMRTLKDLIVGTYGIHYIHGPQNLAVDAFSLVKSCDIIINDPILEYRPEVTKIYLKNTNDQTICL